MAKKGKKVETEKIESKTLMSKEYQNRFVGILLGVFVLLIILIIVMAFIKDRGSIINYNGIKFQKVDNNGVIFYSAKLPIIDASGKVIREINLDLRNDPRELGNIETNTDKILFITSNITYVSFDETNKTYSKGNLASAGLGLFLSRLGLDIKSAVNSTTMNASSIPYVNCDNHKNNTVIMISESNTTWIEKKSIDCYVIHFREDELLKATERFQLIIAGQLVN